MIKAKVSVHKATLKEVVRDFAVEIQAEEHVDLDEDTVMGQVRKAGGADYGTGHVREDLEKKISHRPEKKDLVDKNIMKEGNPKLQATQEALKKEKIVDTLEKKLEHRSDKEDLENRNILKHGNVAPSLQAAQTALEHERIVDNLEKKLEHRSDKEDLENRNILRHGNVAPALQAAQTALEHERIVDTLEKKT